MNVPRMDNSPCDLHRIGCSMGWAGLGLPQRHQGSVPGVGQSLAANTWPAMNIRDILEIVDLERQNVEKSTD